MTLPDDSSVTYEQLGESRSEPHRALRNAGAIGCCPTPVNQIVHAVAFRTRHQTFVLLHARATLRRRIILPSPPKAT